MISWLVCRWFECTRCHRSQDTAKTEYWAQQIYSIVLKKCSMVDILAAGNYTWTSQSQSLVFSSVSTLVWISELRWFSVLAGRQRWWHHWNLSPDLSLQRGQGIEWQSLPGSSCLLWEKLVFKSSKQNLVRGS